MTRFNFDLGKVSLSLRQLSDTGKTKLLCVHGGPGLDQKSLAGIEILKNIFDLILVDLRGHGQSTGPKDADYTLEAYADDIFLVAKKIKTKAGLGIFGHSFGGLVALQTMANYEGVFDFGFLSNSPLDASYQATLGIAAQKHITDISIEAIEKRFSDSPNENASYARLMMDYGPLYFPQMPRSEINLIMASWIFKVAPYNFAETSIFPDMNLKPLCSRINAPVLVIGGKDDDIIPVDHVAGFKKYLKNCELRYVSGGHFPFTTHPDEFSLIVSQWWETQRKDITQ